MPARTTSFFKSNTNHPNWVSLTPPTLWQPWHRASASEISAHRWERLGCWCPKVWFNNGNLRNRWGDIITVTRHDPNLGTTFDTKWSLSNYTVSEPDLFVPRINEQSKPLQKVCSHQFHQWCAFRPLEKYESIGGNHPFLSKTRQTVWLWVKMKHHLQEPKSGIPSSEQGVLCAFLGWEQKCASQCTVVLIHTNTTSEGVLQKMTSCYQKMMSLIFWQPGN